MYSILENTASNINIKVSGYDLIHGLPLDEKLLLIESLACNDEIMSYLLDLLTDTYTKNGFSNSKINKYRVRFLNSVTAIEKELHRTILNNY